MPQEHATDSLSAAINNPAERQELTKRYQALCEHCGLRAKQTAEVNEVRNTPESAAWRPECRGDLRRPERLT